MLIDPSGHLKKINQALTVPDVDPVLEEKDRLIHELELELAQTKLALVESECKLQDMTHQLGTAVAELHDSKSTWFQKTLTSFRDVAKKDPAVKSKDMARKDSKD
jgi:hypothetical protein